MTSQVFSNKNLKTYQKLLCNYRIIAQKLSMLKQGVKTIIAKFIQARVLSQLSVSL